MSDSPSGVLLLSIGVGLVGVTNPALSWGIAGAYAVGTIGYLAVADFADAEKSRESNSKISFASRPGLAPGRRVYG